MTKEIERDKLEMKSITRHKMMILLMSFALFFVQIPLKNKKKNLKKKQSLVYFELFSRLLAGDYWRMALCFVSVCLSSCGRRDEKLFSLHHKINNMASSGGGGIFKCNETIDSGLMSKNLLQLVGWSLHYFFCCCCCSFGWFFSILESHKFQTHPIEHLANASCKRS